MQWVEYSEEWKDTEKNDILWELGFLKQTEMKPK